MTETTRPARANREGHPCPPWCTVDHDHEMFPGHFTLSHGSEGEQVGWTMTRAVLVPSRGQPEVQVSTGGQNGGSLFFEAERAGYLAVLVEELAGATPDQHFKLAAALRQAAAQVTEADHG